MKKDEKNRMAEILNSTDFGISETKGISGVLAKLWRTMLMDLNIKPIVFDTMLYKASKEARSSSTLTNSSYTKYFTVANLRRELEKAQMTFKVFVKGIRLLNNVYKFDLCIKLYYKQSERDHTLHYVTVDLGEIKTSIFEDDITENYVETEEKKMLSEAIDLAKKNKE